LIECKGYCNHALGTHANPNQKATETKMILFLMHLMMLLVPQTVLVSAMASESSLSLKLRVCQGSGCLGKCRGAFNPLTSFEQLSIAYNVDEGSKDCTTATMETTTTNMIEIEESFCLNQCKKGPNVRIIGTKNGKVLVFDDTIMDETEISRKAFQRVVNEERVKRVWGIAKAVVDGELVATEKGYVDKLHDIMPRK